MKKHKLLTLAASAALIFNTAVSAPNEPAVAGDDLFSATVTGGGQTKTAGAPDILSLIADTVRSDGPFRSFENVNNFDASIVYFGLGDAVNINRESLSAKEIATVTSKFTGLDRTFEAPTEDQLKDEIEDWFLEEGADEIAKLERAVAINSAAAISDGNPNSNTALAASDSFTTLGFGSEEVQQTFNQIDGVQSSQESGGFSIGMGIGLNAGTLSIDTDAGEINGTKFATKIPFNFNFNKRLRVLGGFPLNWTELEGTNIFGGGINAGLQYDVIPISAEEPWGWKVAPLAGVSARGTVEGATGTFLYQGGFTSAFTYVIPKKALFTLGTQISHFESIPIKIQGTELDTEIDQQILKNGLKAAVPFGKRVLGDLYVINTAFLKDAAVDTYWTFGAGLSYRITKTGKLGLNFNIDEGDNYSSYNVGLSSAWRF